MTAASSRIKLFTVIVKIRCTVHARRVYYRQSYRPSTQIEEPDKFYSYRSVEELEHQRLED